jgi:hypothetical protein
MEYSTQKHKMRPLLGRLLTLALVVALALLFAPVSRAEEATPTPDATTAESSPEPTAAAPQAAFTLGACSDEVLRRGNAPQRSWVPF